MCNETLSMISPESIQMEDDIQKSEIDGAAPTMLTQNLIYKLEPIEECEINSDYSSEAALHELCATDENVIIKNESIDEQLNEPEILADISIEDDERSNEVTVNNSIAIELQPNDDTTSTQIKCATCEKVFSDVRRLKRHSKVHLTKKPFICDKCGKGFNERADLTKHAARHPTIEMPNKSDEFLYKCPDCFSGFNFERDLNIHASIHTQDGIFACVECKKIFSSKCNAVPFKFLSLERLTQTTPTIFALFSALVQLKRHVRIHFTEKPFKCHVCGMCFAEVSSRTRHYRRHTGEQREKKYLCTTCGKK